MPKGDERDKIWQERWEIMVMGDEEWLKEEKSVEKRMLLFFIDSAREVCSV